MDDSYKSKGHLGVSFQSYQVSTCHAKHCTNTRRNYKTISTIGVATAKEISILETWWSIEPRKWMLRNWTIKFFWLLNCDLISNSWCNLASKHVSRPWKHMIHRGGGEKANESQHRAPTDSKRTDQKFTSKSKMVPWLGSSLLEAYWRFFLGCDIEYFKVRYFKMVDHQLKEFQSMFFLALPPLWMIAWVVIFICRWWQTLRQSHTEILYPTDLYCSILCLNIPPFVDDLFEYLRS